MAIRIVSPSYPRQSGSERILNIMGATADAAAAHMPGNPRHRLKVILVLGALLLVTLVSYSSNPNLHKEQLVHELSQLSDRAFKLPDHLREKFIASQAVLCSKQFGGEQEDGLTEEPEDVAPIRAWEPPVAQPEYIEEIPLIPGFGGALSNPDNPTRNKFLVPIFACDEQETGAQMHIRQALHLGKAMNRTVILPNFGGQGIPTLSNCQSFAFDNIFEIESANSVQLWNAAYPTFKRFIARSTGGRQGALTAQLAVVFSRYAFDQVTHLPIGDKDVLSESCIDMYPYTIEGPRLWVSTENQEPISRVVEALKPASHKDVIFVYFNHKSVFISPEVHDPLLQHRPQWGLWVRNPYPYWNYSTTITDVYEHARAKLPETFLAMQWRMERVPPFALEQCSHLFLDAIVAGAKEHNTDIIYVASDAPLTPDEPFKSASWDLVFSEGVRTAVSTLIEGLKAANLKVVTWKDVKPSMNEDAALAVLADNAPGIFDRLIVGKAATWLYAPNIHCGMKSAYLGAIQTFRQDRIGDTMEMDWNRLGMSWIGEPIPGDFWWTTIPSFEGWDKVGL